MAHFFWKGSQKINGEGLQHNIKKRTNCLQAKPEEVLAARLPHPGGGVWLTPVLPIRLGHLVDAPVQSEISFSDTATVMCRDFL